MVTNWKSALNTAMTVVGFICTVLVTWVEVAQYLELHPLWSPGTTQATPTMTAPVPSWLLITVGLVGLALLLTSWPQIAIRAWSQKSQSIPTNPASTALNGATPITDMKFNTGLLSQVAPWLELYVTMYNGTGHSVRVVSASGRVAINGQEFHGQIELKGHPTIYGYDKFINFGVRVPVSSNEAKYLLALVDLQDGFVADFPNAKIDIMIDHSPASSPRTIDLPAQISFDGNGETRPHFAAQLEC